MLTSTFSDPALFSHRHFRFEALWQSCFLLPAEFLSLTLAFLRWVLKILHDPKYLIPGEFRHDSLQDLCSFLVSIVLSTLRLSCSRSQRETVSPKPYAQALPPKPQASRGNKGSSRTRPTPPLPLRIRASV